MKTKKKKARRVPGVDGLWQLCQGSGRDVIIKTDDPLLSYRTVHLCGPNRENYYPDARRYYGYITRQTDDEIEFDPLTAAEYRQHAARSAEGLHPLRLTV